MRGLRLFFLLLLLLVPTAARASFYFSIPSQIDVLTVGTDGTVYLERRFTFQVSSNSTENGTEIWAGRPTSDTQTLSAVDAHTNQAVPFTDSVENDETIVRFTDFPPIAPGQSKEIIFQAKITNFLYQDTNKSGYATLSYIPGWWDGPVGLERVIVVLPPNVTKSECLTGEHQYDQVTRTQDGRVALIWQQQNLAAGERMQITTGFPAKYLDAGVTLSDSPQDEQTPDPYDSYYRHQQHRDRIGGIFYFLLAVIGVISRYFFSFSRRSQYSSPVISMDGVGVCKGLTPAEAAVLLRLDASRALMIVLFELIRQGLVRIKSQEPLVLEKKDSIGDRMPLHYEQLFLNAISDQGSLNQEALEKCYRVLINRVADKMRPYCRKETEDYYRSQIQQAWVEVEKAGTPQLQFNSYDTKLPWLMGDSSFSERSKNILSNQQALQVPVDYWLWNLSSPGMVNPSISSVFMANELCQAEETLKQNLIQDPEHFAKVADMLYPVVKESARKGLDLSGYHGGCQTSSCFSCACACVSCACACACAGGGGCT